MEKSKPIGVLRLLNEKRQLGLKFKTRKNDEPFQFLDYTTFTDEKTLEIDTKKLLKNVEDKSQKPNYFKNNQDDFNTFKDLLKEDFDLRELNNGHDVLSMLSVALLKAIGNEKNKRSIERTSGQTLEKDFTISYRLEDFKETNLYQQLVEWQNINIEYVLIK